MQLQRLNDFLALLAREGICSNEDEEKFLEEDLYVLTSTHFLEKDSAYKIVLATLNSYDIVHCGGWSDAWRRGTASVSKKFRNLRGV